MKVRDSSLPLFRTLGSEAAVIAQSLVAGDTARFPVSVSPEQQIFRNVGFYSSPVAPTP
jgi:hypothetical protein